MMDGRWLAAATVLGIVLQVAMVVAGHYLPPVRAYFAAGGMAISLAAGLFYAVFAAAGWSGSAAGGAIAGGLCALCGIAVSHLLGDVPAALMLFGTLGSTVAGAIGGAVGRAFS